MNKTNTLNATIYKDGWFVLENVDMDSKLFSELVNTIEKIFIAEYKTEGAKEHVNKVEKDNRLVLFINQKKVPNIIKSLVQHPDYEIKVSLTGIKNKNEKVTRIIEKPFEANKVTELVPAFNNKKKM